MLLPRLEGAAVSWGRVRGSLWEAPFEMLSSGIWSVCI